MAKSVVKGKDVGLYVEKAPGSGTYTRIMCVGSVGLTLTTESDEVDCVDSGDWAESEPGQHSWDGNADLTARQLTDEAGATDATDGVSMENLIDYQIQKRKIKLRTTLGAGVGAARYEGLAYLTKTDIKGANKGNATGSVSLKGTGPLTKTLATA
ncbi:MAG: phage tail tube protein [Janthinobacterium lividum]